MSDLQTSMLNVIRDKLLSVFQTYSIPSDFRVVEELTQITYFSNWTADDVFRSWTSELDDTGLHYLLPDRYHMLCRLTEQDYDYVRIRLGDVDLYVLGMTSKKPYFGPFVTDRMMDNFGRCAQELGHSALHELKLASMLQTQIRQSPELYQRWKKAVRNTQAKHRLHRQFVDRVHHALDMPRDHGHGLTLTPVVAAALACLEHKLDDSQEFVNTCENVVAICHNHIEKHFFDCKTKHVHYDYFFANLIAWHLQLTSLPVYELRGFDLTTNHIPQVAKMKWNAFVKCHQNINLWYDVCLLLPVDIQNAIIEYRMANTDFMM